MSTESRKAKAERRRLAAKKRKLTENNRYRSNFSLNIKSDAREILENGISNLFDVKVEDKKCLHEKGVGLEITVAGIQVSLYFYPHQSRSGYVTSSGMAKIEFLIKEDETYAEFRELISAAVSGFGLGFTAEAIVSKHFYRYSKESGVRLTWQPVVDRLIDINEGYDGLMRIEENVAGTWIKVAEVKTDIKYGNPWMLQLASKKPDIAIFSLDHKLDYYDVRWKIKEFVRIVKAGDIPRV